MADKTHIEWADATWNPITGCSIVSKGCANCYAMQLAGTRLKTHPSRHRLTHQVNGNHVWTGEVRWNEKQFAELLTLRKPRMVFVGAHTDLFHPNVPDAWLDRIFGAIFYCSHHIFQVLTKRPDRMKAYFAEGPVERIKAAAIEVGRQYLKFDCEAEGLYPHICRFFPNVWLGVSIEDQATANERIPLLLDTPASTRFVSAEPLLGAVDLTKVSIRLGNGLFGDPLSIHHRPYRDNRVFPTLDWVICGGESGPKARPMHPDWARSLRDQCAAAGVPFFFKQWGEWLGGEFEDFGEYQRFTSASFDTHSPPVVDFDRVHFFAENTCPAGPAAIRIGKAHAGDHLDGVQHHAWPKVRR